MEAHAARLRGDDLPPAVPIALLVAGLLLEFAALERWQPAFMEDPAVTTAPPPAGDAP